MHTATSQPSKTTQPARTAETGITLLKGRRAFRFVCTTGEEVDLAKHAAALATRPESGFDAFDAAVVAFELARAASSPPEHREYPSRSAQ